MKMGTRTLYLVRHGQQAATRDPGAEEDNLGTGLTRLGIQQARAVARRLQEVPLSMIHTSTLRRAAQTARAIAAAWPNVPVTATDDLWEAMPAVPVGVPTGLAASFSRQVGEDAARIRAAFTTYFQPSADVDLNEVIVCHGNLIRYFACRVLHVPAAAWASMMIHHCGLTVIKIEEDGRRFLVSHNDVGHLPPELRTLS